METEFWLTVGYIVIMPTKNVFLHFEMLVILYDLEFFVVQLLMKGCDSNKPIIFFCLDFQSATLCGPPVRDDYEWLWGRVRRGP